MMIGTIATFGYQLDDLDLHSGSQLYEKSKTFVQVIFKGENSTDMIL